MIARTLFLLPLLALVSCQVPSSISFSDATLTPETTPTIRRPLLVGLEAPSWENVEKQIDFHGWDRRIDDTYTRIRTDEKVIAITFDDGPHPENTPRLLDMLKKRNIRATFYVVGNMVKYNPDLLKRMVEEGHEIGNHTVTHGNLARMSNESLRQELRGAHEQIVEATEGIEPRTMRPPGGAITKAQKELMLEEFGYPTILWSVDPEDWKRPGVSVVTSRLVNGASSGGILLAHDLHKPTVDAMPSTLDQLLASGYRFVTVSELIEMEAPPEPADAPETTGE